METVNDTAMHVTEKKTLSSSLTCPISTSEEISKEKEEELLYGNNEDCDEEDDAASDDSIRLKVSDDEADLDEPSASENMNNDKIEPESTNMELGSDVPAKDTSQQKITLREEKLTNGKCTINEINKKSGIEQEEQSCNDDFTSDTLPLTDNFFSESDKTDSCNGTSVQANVKKSSDRLSIRNQANGNPMIDYFRRANRHTLPRLPQSQSSKFFTNSYNNKYYNKNTHYGGGKGCGRGFNNTLRTSVGPESSSDVKYSPRVVPSNNPEKETVDNQNTSISLKIKTEDSKTEPEINNPADSAIAKIVNADLNLVEKSNMNESLENPQSSTQDPKDISKNDNAVAANSINSSDKTPESEESNATSDRENSTANKSLNNELNQVEVKSEIDDSNVSVASDETVIADYATDIAENITEDEAKSSTEIESTSCMKEQEKVHINESNNLPAEQDVITDVDDKAEDVATPKQDEITTDTLSTEAKLPEVEKVINQDSNNVEKETEAAVDSTDAASEETNFVATTVQIESNVVCEEVDKLTPIEETSNDPSETKQGPETPIEEKCDEEYAAVSQSEPKVSEKQMITDANSEQPIEEPPSVVNASAETVEKSVISADAKDSAEPKTSEIEDSIADLPDEKETSSDDECEGNNVKIVHCSMKRMPTESLDEMELSKRMRIRRIKPNDSSESAETKVNDTESSSLKEKIENDEKTVVNNDSVVDPVTNNVPDAKLDSETKQSVTNNAVVETSSMSPKAEEDKSTAPMSVDKGESIKQKTDDCEVIEVPVKRRQKRMRRSLQDTIVNNEDTQEKENVRQKRRTAINAEEIIRKELRANSDSESSDSADKFVPVKYTKTSNDSRAASPPTLKRNHTDEDEKVTPKIVKKLKHDTETNGDAAKKEPETRLDKVQILRHVKQFFRRDNNGKLLRLTQEELEELLIQKVVESITMRDEIGKLREQAKISERNQEATRERCQRLAKQIKDFEMVLNRYHSDRRSNPDKNVVPIKINRSVGLQVNFVTDHGVQNLRQLAQTQKTAAAAMNGVITPQRSEQAPNTNSLIKRTIKVRSPRRPDPATPVSPATATVPSPIHNPPIISNVTPAALVVAKSVQDTRPSVTSTVQQTSLPQLVTSNQTILVNGLTNTPVRTATIQMSKPKSNNDLIDLTQEEDKTKTTVLPPNTILATALAEQPPNVPNVSNMPQRYHTVIQGIPGNVAISAPPGIRVVQSSGQPTPTALVNNMNASRLTYVMQAPGGTPRQVVFTSAPTQIRPALDHQNRPIRTTFPISGTITNGTVRVIPTNATATLQVCKHPAALPESINPPANPGWKLPPPAPSLKISKVANGIVLSWNMALSDKFADIASYQLYAYQEVAGIAPSSTLWKKVGDVRALPLPMACTLTQFSEGNNYYFAVRAVDRHSRLGQYSQPGNISL